MFAELPLILFEVFCFLNPFLNINCFFKSIK
jgi:hypothetical protein